jgi:hypothetical protein
VQVRFGLVKTLIICTYKGIKRTAFDSMQIFFTQKNSMCTLDISSFNRLG